MNEPLDELLDHLTHGDIDMEGYVPWGSNYTFVVMLQHNGRELKGVYKPRRGEQPLWDFPSGTLCQREYASYLISEALGWGVVPPTVLRDGPEGYGSMQLFIEHDPNEHFFTFKENPDFQDQLRRIALLDIMINNADRKGGHLIIDEDDKIWAIDHGIALHEDPKLRTVIWEYAGEKIAPPLLDDLRQFAQKLNSDQNLCLNLSRLLRTREMDALSARTERLLFRGVYPQPGPGRPYPWPLI